ncbi:MAG TPA: hypothetical protein PK266_08255 [Candidatus Saccharicenans sp.]|nr:hypothetical protein [Candidatus Saccharicenans sp.]HPB60028.1 hypothetical protein [Candidatus Saccharicenans sp.]HUM79931.1 hypothetical protein [Candidatus Saccharicenans sp.]
MAKLSEQLTDKERKILKRIALAGLVSLGLLIITLFFWSRRLDRLNEEALALQSEVDKLAARMEEKLAELQSWQLTQADLVEMEENSFYAGQAGIEAFRQDLSQVFQKAGLPLPPISYQYEEDQKKEFRRLSASFGVSLSYPRLKRFLFELEAWPRIWILDQINFQKIDNAAGIVDLRLTIAGFYYEEK